MAAKLVILLTLQPVFIYNCTRANTYIKKESASVLLKIYSLSFNNQGGLICHS